MIPATRTPKFTEGTSRVTSALAQELPTTAILLQLTRPAPSIELIEVKHGYRPWGSFGLSLLVHGFALFSLIYLGHHAFLRPSVVRVRPAITSADSVTFLPLLGGGTTGSGAQGGGRGRAKEVSSGVRARSRQGFAYPGPQPMLSNPDGARLGVQTLLQPSLENLPRLHHILELPNIVQPPPSTTTTKAPPLVVKSGKVAVTTRADNTLQPPKVVLRVAEESGIASLLEVKPQLPKRAVPDAVKASELSAPTRKPGALLVLNAIPPAPDVRSLVPRAEARSLFAGVPGDATIIAAPAAGSESGGQSAAAAGNGTISDIQTGDAIAEAASGGTNANPHPRESGTGNGGRYGDGKGPGINAENHGHSAGRGDASSSGLGTGSAGGSGSGSGGGSAPGTGHFAGITIQGGRYGKGVSGSSGSMLAESMPHRQTSYDMTIVSTGSSGGGLPELGVFQNEKVYTVYLDMRANDEDPRPSWTLQYAVLQPSATPGDDPPPPIQGTPTPPYAMQKEVPDFSPDLLRKVGHRLIVASAIMDTSGKLEDVTVRQTPDSQLTAPLVEALRQWLFQPAQIDGRPVALKVLLGMRWALPR